jgi:hypothetical protein
MDCGPNTFALLGYATLETCNILADRTPNGMAADDVVGILNDAYGGGHKWIHINGTRNNSYLLRQVNPYLRNGQATLGSYGSDAMGHYFAVCRERNKLWVLDSQSQEVLPLVVYMRRMEDRGFGRNQFYLMSSNQAGRYYAVTMDLVDEYFPEDYEGDAVGTEDYHADEGDDAEEYDEDGDDAEEYDEDGDDAEEYDEDGDDAEEYDEPDHTMTQAPQPHRTQRNTPQQAPSVRQPVQPPPPAPYTSPFAQPFGQHQHHASPFAQHQQHASPFGQQHRASPFAQPFGQQQHHPSPFSLTPQPVHTPVFGHHPSPFSLTPQPVQPTPAFGERSYGSFGRGGTKRMKCKRRKTRHRK